MDRIEIMKDIINFDSSNDDGNALQCNLDDHYEITIFFLWKRYIQMIVAINSNWNHAF